MSQDINVLAMAKGEERYLFLFNDETRAELLRTLGRFASDPDLSFTWHDAAVLSQKIRSTVKSNTANSVLGTNRLQSPPLSDLFTSD
ncbi:MAG TPA: hypothetical protein PKD54_07215 [Pirellulaceae bacterium]|nr:hypothetical protein [Pirellulaceae bacterium]